MSLLIAIMLVLNLERHNQDLFPQPMAFLVYTKGILANFAAKGSEISELQCHE